VSGAADWKRAISELLQPQERSQVVVHSGLGWNILLDPALKNVEHLPAIIFDHHEMAIANKPMVLQSKVLGIAAGLLQEFNHGPPLRPDLSAVT